MRALNSKYQRMLAHKVDGKYPEDYSSLLLAKMKLERRMTEARDPLPPKTTVTNMSDMIHSPNFREPLPLTQVER